jgi:5-methyltetrahydrofolate--homocysteine methyltransferase
MLVAMSSAIPAYRHAYDTDILETLSQRVVVGDGAMGTQLQAADLVETKYVRLQSG